MFQTKIKNNAEKGFTLIEILVALLLVTIVLGLVTSNPFSSRKNLDEALNYLERAVRFSSDESTLRNAMVRIHFKMEKDPQSYSVEYGPSGGFILSIPKSLKDLSSRDAQKEKKKQNKVNSAFTKVKEFKDSDKSLPDYVRILGVATSLQETLVTESEANIYIYPTGEKDNAIIILGTEDEVVAMTMEPFTQEFKRKYVTLDEDSGEELEDQQQAVAKELYEEWLKN
jgi:prepilin-type N-terminal cleavage/methylation domain-containing protein